MGNGLENPTVAPQRPYFGSMKRAVSMLIEFGNRIGDVDLHRVAMTYCATEEQVTAEWERQLTEASLKPSNAYETPEGK